MGVASSSTWTFDFTVGVVFRLELGDLIFLLDGDFPFLRVLFPIASFQPSSSLSLPLQPWSLAIIGPSFKTAEEETVREYIGCPISDTGKAS